MNWREWNSECYAARGSRNKPEFRVGASREQIDQVEAVLGVRVPAEIRDLLLQTDGVGELYLKVSGGWGRDIGALWSCDEMIRWNREIHAEPDAPTVPLERKRVALFVARPGVDGILFAVFVNVDAADDDPSIHAWYPMERAWRRISPTLRDHLRGWSV